MAAPTQTQVQLSRGADGVVAVHARDLTFVCTEAGLAEFGVSLTSSLEPGPSISGLPTVQASDADGGTVICASASSSGSVQAVIALVVGDLDSALGQLDDIAFGPPTPG